MMKPHKHAEVIRAWADNQDLEIEYRFEGGMWCLCRGIPEWASVNEYRVKPEPPAKVYPVTTMAHSEMFSVYASHLRNKHGYNGVAAESSGLAEVANAALRHAIDAGQIVTKDEHESALIQLGEHLRGIAIAPDAVRDMAIAEAVRTKCKLITSRMLSDDANRAIGYIDLATIIATIK